jgi:hypothetical protein
MPPIVSVLQIRRLALVFLCIALGTLLWAGASMYLGSAQLYEPYAIELLIVLSGAIAFFGGCIGVLYLAALFVIPKARTLLAVSAGVLVTLGNFGYVWWYIDALARQ